MKERGAPAALSPFLPSFGVPGKKSYFCLSLAIFFCKGARREVERAGPPHNPQDWLPAIAPHPRAPTIAPDQNRPCKTFFPPPSTPNWGAAATRGLGGERGGTVRLPGTGRPLWIGPSFTKAQRTPLSLPMDAGRQEAGRAPG